jgi:hypothetical protein
MVKRILTPRPALQGEDAVFDLLLTARSFILAETSADNVIDLLLEQRIVIDLLLEQRIETIRIDCGDERGGGWTKRPIGENARHPADLQLDAVEATAWPLRLRRRPDPGATPGHHRRLPRQR